MSNVERRVITGTIELRGAGAAKMLRGYASIFNSDSEDLGGFIERIAPGAFTDALTGSPDIRCLFNHDQSALLGRTASKTLKVSQDSRGLYYECTLPDTQLGHDILVMCERGDITQSSFAFSITDDGQTWSDNYSRRLITKVAELYDVSPVTVPAYPAASVSARNAFLFSGESPQPVGAIDDEKTRASLRLTQRQARFAAEKQRDYLRAKSRLDAKRAAFSSL